MLKERAEAYYKQGYNCAETMIRAANDEYNLGLDDNAMKLTAGFGGGMGCGKACGALTGSACAISAKLVETKANQAPELRAKITALVAAFNRILGDTECKNLTIKYKNPECGCLKTVLLACEALEAAMQ